MSEFDTDKLARFAELSARKRELQEELKQTNTELGVLEEQLLPQFENAGVQNMRINGMTVFIHRQIWAGAEDGDTERAVDALKAAGLTDYVAEKFNTNSLSAWVREQVAVADTEDLYDALPPEFRGSISVAERFQLRARRS